MITDSDKKAQIISVNINKIKSFNNTKINFRDGINIISGENGSGKSTIFEAIGFCLFGVKPSDFIGNLNNFLRHGEKSCEVEIEYLGIDGNVYLVRRTHKGTSTIKMMSDNGWFPLEEGEINEIICRTLDLRTSIEIDKQFTNIIGPFQSDFVTPFLLNRIERNKRFDEILGIEKWRNLFENTSGLRGSLNNKISLKNSEIAIKKEQIEDLEEIKLITRRKIDEKSKIKDTLNTLSPKIEEINNKILTLEKTKDSINILNNEFQILKENRKWLENDLKNLIVDFDNTLKSKEISDLNKAGFEKYEESLKIKGVLEKEILNRNALNKEISDLSQIIIENKTRIDVKFKTNKSNDEKSNIEKQKLISIIKETKILKESSEQQVEIAKNLLDSINRIKERFLHTDIGIIERTRYDVDRLIARLTAIENETSGIGELRQNIANLEKSVRSIEELSIEVEKINNEISALEHFVKEKERAADLLSKGQCPFLGENCLNLSGKSPALFFESQITEFKSNLEEKRKHVEEKKQSLKNAREDNIRFVELKEQLKNIEKLFDEKRILENNIKTSITIEQIIDLFNTFSSPLQGLENEKIKKSLENAQYSISRMKLLDEIRDYPKSLESIEQIFQDARKDINSIIDENLKKSNADFQNMFAKDNKLSENLKNFENSLAEVEIKIVDLTKERDDSIKISKEIEIRQKNLDNLNLKLSSYSKIDEKMENINEALKINKDSHSLYNQNFKDAEKTTILKSKIDLTQSEIESKDTKISEIGKQLSEIDNVFNQKDLDLARESLTQAFTEIEREKSNLKQIEDEVGRLQLEIEKKLKIEEEITLLNKESLEIEKTLEFIDFLRNSLLKNIAPNVSYILRNNISETAAKIYRNISNKNEELCWGDGYSVELHEVANGIKTIRKDRLSGGQFMSAVIALRLALLQAVGSPFAFFDEPTSNLDEERRKNLAEAFRSLNNDGSRWYRQLFLVSHDESFHGISGNLIELEIDEQGCSKII